MTLAEDRVPRGGTVGDEAFDHISALGTTNFVANVNLYAGIGASPRAPLPRCPMSRRRAFTRSWRGASRSGASGSTHTHRSLRLLGEHRLSRPGARPSAPMGRSRPQGAGGSRPRSRACCPHRSRSSTTRGTAPESALQDDVRVLVQAASAVAGVTRWNSASPGLVLPEPRPASGRQATA
jgi:hypothetical protein